MAEGRMDGAAPAAAGPGGAGEFHYPCAQCGADLRFAPGQSRLQCDHCGHVQEIPGAVAKAARGIEELDLAAALARALPGEALAEARTVSCPNCGAVVEFDGDRHAAECPFCATPVVIDTGTSRQIKPQALVAFAVDEAAARAALGTWLRGRWFAPNGLADYARRGRRMQGIYMPFWTFDAETQSRYTGQRGDHYYETRSVTVNVNGKSERRDERVRRTRWTAVSGFVRRRFDDVLVLASRSLPPAMTAGLAPWDLAALLPYRPDYLAGFLAEGYTVELGAGHAEARETMARVIEGDVRRDIGGDEQRITGISTAYRAETFKHVLLPVWTAAYRYRDRSYRIVVNGQTGKVQGERPWSPWKIALALLALALLGALAYLVAQNR